MKKQLSPKDAMAYEDWRVWQKSQAGIYKFLGPKKADSLFHKLEGDYVLCAETSSRWARYDKPPRYHRRDCPQLRTHYTVKSYKEARSHMACISCKPPGYT